MLSYLTCMALIAAVGYGLAGAPGILVGVVAFAVFDAAGAARRRRQTMRSDPLRRHHRTVGRDHHR